ncbi:GntR family transcriptional regulator (plasmid) [Bosea sp. F3-2]|uniref:GntR family transcriptional regulator n=1 Tax=Bosea sp. F3-2 TaxID=2599640 RepID=UPI0011F05BB0|nr:GntR family transcriptional regulator [Bosea sp. F3-2]QEL27311.1 GntR family transcriptional regulator [Bosea sp. F3-2]
MKADVLVAQRHTLETVIYDELRKRIISLTYPPGTMIFENVVAADFGVSRTPVRKAFVHLAADDLITILPQRGAQISNLSLVKVKEAQFVREALEISAFSEVARIWDSNREDHRAAETEILDLIERQKASVVKKDYMLFTQLDEDYHNRIIEISGNSTLLSMVNHMRAHLNRVRYLELQEAQHEEPAIVFHQQIFDAIRRNDVTDTAEKLRAHLKMLEDIRDEIFARHPTMFE